MNDLNEITEKIIGAAYHVSNSLGIGFLKKVYENAISIELGKIGLSIRQQHPVTVKYDNQIVGEFFADILVEDAVLGELKAVKALDEIHMAQCLNYLKASGLNLCLLINFGTRRIQIKRLIN